MFKNSYQCGLFTVFSSTGAKPLQIWQPTVKFGHVKRILDEDINSLVMEIRATNVSSTFIRCPPGDKVLGIRLPFMVLILKNLNKYFTFEVTIMDDQLMRRRFHVSNFSSRTKIAPFVTLMPIRLAPNWNQVLINLADFTRRAYKTSYLETLKIQVNGNVRLKRIYFADRLYTENELPKEYRLYNPLARNARASKESLQKKAEDYDARPPPPSPGKEEFIQTAPLIVASSNLQNMVVQTEESIKEIIVEKTGDAPMATSSQTAEISKIEPKMDVQSLTAETEATGISEVAEIAEAEKAESIIVTEPNDVDGEANAVDE